MRGRGKNKEKKREKTEIKSPSFQSSFSSP